MAADKGNSSICDNCSNWSGCIIRINTTAPTTPDQITENN